MNPVIQSVAKDYTPSTPAASQAAKQFVNSVNAWSAKYGDATRELCAFVEAKVGHRPRGFISRDRLNMSAFGLVFDRAPGPGFLAVPSAVSEELRAQGLRGEGYFPDTGHPLGKEVMARLQQVSRIAEQRPLLNSVPGVAPVAIDSGRLVLSRAMATEDGYLLKASPAAVSPTAEVKAVAAPDESPTPASRARFTM